MKTINATKSATFAAGNVYEFNRDAAKFDIRNQLSAKISQAQAMLNMLVSDGGLEHFGTMSDDSQADYIWGISMAIDESKGLIDQL